MRQILLVLLVAVCITSCHKNGKYSVSGNYIVMGRTGGLAGPMALTDYFVLDQNQLRKDATVYGQQVPDDINKFSFTVVMPTSKYDSVKDILTTIPSELLGITDGNIGTAWPDFGYLDVRASVNGTAYKWRFQADQSASSPEIQAFLGKIDMVFN